MLTKEDSIVIIGVGGATCSGKTTLAKHLLNILHPTPPSTCTRISQPNSTVRDAFILHQDDFAPLEETLPWNQEFQVRDWDWPDGAIQYEKMRSTLDHIRSTGSIPEGFKSHDHLNHQPDRPIPDSQVRSWRQRFHSLKLQDPSASRAVGGEATESSGPKRLTFVIADGFLLYYDPKVRESIDVRILLRVPKRILWKRREERFGYATGEGTVWKDPPNYFPNIVWPAYVEAHKKVFEAGDVEKGRVVVAPPRGQSNEERGGPIRDLVLISNQSSDEEMSMEEMVESACQAIWETLSRGGGV
ncbi:P-loop containing nucleoside triphosphate hydrolase protein [Violaceomyces palustris]|uniref:P-loop containing nucleoside triphosphate hydrolase protein n=1 Tax=Violaceomyces palustris TaxID=1673888 RepID=A0ACD0NXN5_9BASI|nr:P-loop containing nucleoside triphosphate hydrolase protein [Violaceomyces palustris]